MFRGVPGLYVVRASVHVFYNGAAELPRPYPYLARTERMKLDICPKAQGPQKIRKPKEPHFLKPQLLLPVSSTIRHTYRPGLIVSSDEPHM